MKPMSYRAARAEAKRIVDLAIAKHGEPVKSDDFVEVIDTIEKEAYKWRMMAAMAIMIYHTRDPRWTDKRKAAFVLSERETTSRIYAELEPMIEELKLGFREAVAKWFAKYGHRKSRRAVAH
jgi:hypothetical protein